MGVSGQKVSVIGPKGILERELPKELGVEVKDNKATVVSKRKDRATKALHGTYRAIIANMVTGVNKGWSKALELVGTGYRAELSAKNLVLSVGYSHPVKIEAPEGVTFKVEKDQVTVEGIDKELVGEVADRIRSIRPPEPYKGKGIKYKEELIRRKPGKVAKAQGIGTA